ncbi:hypothetical protein ES707_16864 [subsurface metagenome]
MCLVSGIKRPVAARDDDACRRDLDNPLLILAQDGLPAADVVAEAALDAVLGVLDDDIGDRLRMGLINRFPHADAGVELIVDLHRADPGAVPTPVALVLDDVAGVLPDPDPEPADLSLDRLDLGAGVDGDVLVPGHLHHLRREDAHGAVVGGERLVELGHMPADGRFAFDEVHVDIVVCKVERCLDAGNPGADDHDVSHGGTSLRV